MTTMASQITSLTVVYSTVYSDSDQRKYQSSASLAFVRGIHRDRWIPRTKGQLRGKCFHLMTSSCYLNFLVDSRDFVIPILQDCFIGAGTISRNIPEGYGYNGPEQDGTWMSEAGIKGRDKILFRTDTVRSDYLSLSLIDASDTQVLLISK